MDCDDADYWTHVVTVKFNDCMVTANIWVTAGLFFCTFFNGAFSVAQTV
jgi:hypothetical protein